LRYSPFLAVYSSDGRVQNAFSSDINLVNVYRVIFNVIFNTKLPLLPADSFFSPYDDSANLLKVSQSKLEQKCSDMVLNPPQIDSVIATPDTGVLP
jgi:hypothetical protein